MGDMDLNQPGAGKPARWNSRLSLLCPPLQDDGAPRVRSLLAGTFLCSLLDARELRTSLRHFDRLEVCEKLFLLFLSP